MVVHGFSCTIGSTSITRGYYAEPVRPVEDWATLWRELRTERTPLSYYRPRTDPHTGGPCLRDYQAIGATTRMLHKLKAKEQP